MKISRELQMFYSGNKKKKQDISTLIIALCSYIFYLNAATINVYELCLNEANICKWPPTWSIPHPKHFCGFPAAPF